MNKQETIKNLELSINSQEFIMTSLKNSIKLKRESETTEIFDRAEEFGNFFYHESNNLNTLLGTILFDGISKCYELWKETLDRLHNMLVVDTSAKKPKLKKLSIKDEEIIKAIYDDLLIAHNSLKKQCNTAHARLSALSNDKFV